MSDGKRGFVIVNAYLDKDVNIPKKATPGSAGYDFAAAESLSIAPGKIGICPTGIKAYMEKDEVLQIYPRSSLFLRKNLILVNSVGIIDHDFYDNSGDEGHIRILLYNMGHESQTIEKGERIVQGIFMKHLEANTEALLEGSRSGGIGSTGK